MDEPGCLLRLTSQRGDKQMSKQVLKEKNMLVTNATKEINRGVL